MKNRSSNEIESNSDSSYEAEPECEANGQNKSVAVQSAVKNKNKRPLEEDQPSTSKRACTNKKNIETSRNFSSVGYNHLKTIDTKYYFGKKRCNIIINLWERSSCKRKSYFEYKSGAQKFKREKDSSENVVKYTRQIFRENEYHLIAVICKSQNKQEKMKNIEEVKKFCDMLFDTKCEKTDLKEIMVHYAEAVDKNINDFLLDEKGGYKVGDKIIIDTVKGKKKTEKKEKEDELPKKITVRSETKFFPADYKLDNCNDRCYKNQDIAFNYCNAMKRMIDEGITKVIYDSEFNMEDFKEQNCFTNDHHVWDFKIPLDNQVEVMPAVKCVIIDSAKHNANNPDHDIKLIIHKIKSKIMAVRVIQFYPPTKNNIHKIPLLADICITPVTPYTLTQFGIVKSIINNQLKTMYFPEEDIDKTDIHLYVSKLLESKHISLCQNHMRYVFNSESIKNLYVKYYEDHKFEGRKVNINKINLTSIGIMLFTFPQNKFDNVFKEDYLNVFSNITVSSDLLRDLPILGYLEVDEMEHDIETEFGTIHNYVGKCLTEFSTLKKTNHPIYHDLMNVNKQVGELVRQHEKKYEQLCILFAQELYDILSSVDEIDTEAKLNCEVYLLLRKIQNKIQAQVYVDQENKKLSKKCDIRIIFINGQIILVYEGKHYYLNGSLPDVSLRLCSGFCQLRSSYIDPLKIEDVKNENKIYGSSDAAVEDAVKRMNKKLAKNCINVVVSSSEDKNIKVLLETGSYLINEPKREINFKGEFMVITDKYATLTFIPKIYKHRTLTIGATENEESNHTFRREELHEQLKHTWRHFK